MLAFLAENAATIIIGIVTAAIVGAAVVAMIKKKKTGGCSCGCANCPMSGSCHK